MAKKPVKKTTAKRAAPRVVVAPAPAPTMTCNCSCQSGGFGRFLKKLLVFLVIFTLGFAACKFFCCCAKKHGMMGMNRPEFVNGCMDIQRDITRMNDMAVKHMEKLRTMDADTNGCITEDEFKASKKMWKRNKDADRKVVERVELVEVVE